MLTLTVARRALFASCAVACIGGALLLPSLARGPGLAGVRGPAVGPAKRPAEIISTHRGVLARGAAGVRSGRPPIQHEPAPSPEVVHDYAGEREPVSYRDIWPTIGVGDVALAMFSNPPPMEGPASQVGGCIGDDYAVNCAMQWRRPVDPFVRIVPQSTDQAEQAEASARDRKWVAYCKPFVVQDRYGVSRYHYAQAGCEFGAVGN
jgi:hypothetical protein